MLDLLITAMVLCTNSNYNISSVCKAPVSSFVSDGNKGGSGVLESGVEFTQTVVISDPIYIAKFQLQDAYWYTDGSNFTLHPKGDETITPLQALSIYLTL